VFHPVFGCTQPAALRERVHTREIAYGGEQCGLFQECRACHMIGMRGAADGATLGAKNGLALGAWH
jgi:hypothetical protein